MFPIHQVKYELEKNKKNMMAWIMPTAYWEFSEARPSKPNLVPGRYWCPSWENAVGPQLVG